MITVFACYKFSAAVAYGLRDFGPDLSTDLMVKLRI